MVLGVHGQVVAARIAGQAARHRPGREHPLVLQAQVPVQAAGVVLLDDEPGVAAVGPAGVGRPLGTGSGVRAASRLRRYSSSRSVTQAFSGNPDRCAGRRSVRFARRPGARRGRTDLMDLTDQPTALLPGDVRMPLLGFGTWQATGQAGYDAVLAALDAGYRHLDTATMYGNEQEVGRAMRESGLRREDIFITTKLPPDRVGRERATLEASLAALGVDHVDLWLIHWPPSSPADSIPMWRRAARRPGREPGPRGRGEQLQHRADRRADPGATEENPAVNQIRWSPSLYDRQRHAEHRDRGVVLEGYSPFKTTDLSDPVLTADRRRARRLPGAGGAALAHRPRDRGDPEVGDPGADRRQLRRLPLLARPPRRCATSTRSARSETANSFMPRPGMKGIDIDVRDGIASRHHVRRSVRTRRRWRIAMARTPSIRLRRRGVLGIPALVVAALTVVTRPAAGQRRAEGRVPRRPAPGRLMATIPWLVDVLRAAGVQVVVEGDWLNRMRPGAFDPIGVLWHHTAATSSASNPHPALNICINGRSDLPGPLCQALVDYNGVFHVISAGRCNHAGASRGSGPIPAGDGNTMMIGWEIDYNGVNQEMTTAQYNASLAATAAVLTPARPGRQLCPGPPRDQHHRQDRPVVHRPRRDARRRRRADGRRRPAWSSMVDNTTAGRFTASANWGVSTVLGAAVRRRLPLRRPGRRQRRRLVQVQRPGDRQLPGRGLVAGELRLQQRRARTSSPPAAATRPSSSTSGPPAGSGASSARSPSGGRRQPGRR